MFEGVKSPNPLLPILTPPEVVSRIMKAVKINQEELYIPGILYLHIYFRIRLPSPYLSLAFSYLLPSLLVVELVRLNYLLRFLAPPSVRDVLGDLLGVSRSMDDFAGLRRINH